MTKAPMRQVRQVIEVEGVRGGRMLVMVLSCGHWVTSRSKSPSPKLATACIGCVVTAAAEAAKRDG